MDIDDSDRTKIAREPVSKADDAALELMKQLITLASGVLALSAAFVDKLPKAPKYMFLVLFVSWLALVISIFFGLKTISAIVKSRLNSDIAWSKGEGKRYARFCQNSFLGGIALFAVFAFVSLAFPSSKEGEIKVTIQADDPRIIQGLKGARGEQGPPGPKGPQGDKGLPGDPVQPSKPKSDLQRR